MNGGGSRVLASQRKTKKMVYAVWEMFSYLVTALITQYSFKLKLVVGLWKSDWELFYVKQASKSNTIPRKRNTVMIKCILYINPDSKLFVCNPFIYFWKSNKNTSVYPSIRPARHTSIITNFHKIILNRRKIRQWYSDAYGRKRS